ncbi:hypothetical protein ACET9A_08930 [Aeromonas veronii]|uniref:hypothetical protein n=1 Tax=Aeromonas veronii TaxID=654 RepID=UPI0038F2C03F
MKTQLLLSTSFAVVISGCATNATTPGNSYGWNSMEPPRENVLGREILAGGVIGDFVLKVTPDDIESSKSLNRLKNDEYTKAEAGFDLLVKGVSADLGYEKTKSEKLNSNDWLISQIKDFAYTLPVERKFVYQCLAAEKYEFSATSKSGIDATIDAAKLGEKFGVEKANVTIKTNPDNPNEFSVTVENPNVCLSYVSAYFKDNNWYGTGSLKDKYVDITGVNGDEKYSVEFTLKPGEKSHFRTPQFIGPEPAHKPWYRLMATLDDNGRVNLAVCKQDRGAGDRGYKCNELEDDGYGNWDRPYHVDTFSYETQKYKVVNLNINAKRKDDGTIKVSWAKLQYPQYILVIE